MTDKEPSMAFLVDSIKLHADKIKRLSNKLDCPCQCPEETDPYGTGDTWLVVRNCERPERCYYEQDDNQDDEEDDNED